MSNQDRADVNADRRELADEAARPAPRAEANLDGCGDRDLVVLCLGDGQQARSAFDRLTERHERTFLRRLARRFSPSFDYHSALQEGYLKFWRNRTQFIPGEGPDAGWVRYMWRVIYRAALDQIRREKRHFRLRKPLPENIKDRPVPVPSGLDPSLKDVVRRLIESVHFSPTERTILIYRILEGQVLDEITKAIGRPASTVYRMLNRALTKLRKLLTEREGGGHV